MKEQLPRYLLGLAVLAVLLGHAAGFYRLGFIGHLDAIIYDTKVRLTMPRTQDSRVAIVDIDEKSLAEVGRWPWNRERMATLMNKLFDRHGIALLGFDIVFAEPDTSSGLPVLESLAKQEGPGAGVIQSLLKDLRPSLDYDAQFAAALKQRPVVLGFYLSSKERGTSSGALPEPTLPPGTFAGRGIAFTSWDNFGGNLPEFQKNAAGGGHFNPLVDFDGISRRVPMLAEHAGAYYEALSLAMVRALLGFPKVVPGYAEGNGGKDGYPGLEWLDLPTARGTVRIPVDENVAALIPYRGFQGSYAYLSAADILADRVPTDKLKGKIVLMGTTAPGLMDLRATSVGEAYPGVEIHANLISGMLDGTIKYRPAYVLGAEVVLLLLAGAVMIFLLPLLSPMRASLAALVVLLFLISVNLGFWHVGNLVLPLAAGLLLVSVLYLLNMSWGYFVVSKAKRQLTGLFGQYVPPELVEEMSRDPANYSMAGRKAELTVLFSDVRGFTTISEGLQPDQLATLMNQYLGAMTAVIRDHRGTLDKYIGDAIMAFWGAPVDDPAHARHAVTAALEMQAALPALNRDLAAKGWPELTIGIGVNSGNMTVGDMGSPVRQSYTVMGDAVNLCSRLEGITKQYGVGIIVGEGTRQMTGDSFVYRELDRVRVKGKAEPVGIFEPIGREGAVAREDLDELKLWNQALRAYRAQDWDQAEVQLLNLSRIRRCYLYDLYTKRIEHYRRDPPGAGWDGVTTFETK
jgi:adenylate cyclase